MKKIYLFCSAGMSTSMLAGNMQEVADEHGMPVEVKAFSIAKMEEIYEELHPDCILLGPQVKFLYAGTRSTYEKKKYTGRRNRCKGLRNDEWGSCIKICS